MGIVIYVYLHLSLLHPHSSTLTPPPSLLTLTPPPSLLHPHSSTLTPPPSLLTLTPPPSLLTLTPPSLPTLTPHPHSTLTPPSLLHPLPPSLLTLTPPPSLLTLTPPPSLLHPHSSTLTPPPSLFHSHSSPSLFHLAPLLLHILFLAQFEQLAIEGCIHKAVLAVLKDHSDVAELVEGSMEILIFLAQIGKDIAGVL